MLNFFQPGHPFEGQTQRLVAEAQNGGGDLFDIARVCRRIEIGDAEAWDREWLGLAQATEAAARAAQAAGNTATAMHRFFHANQYYRQSDVFFTGKDPRKAERFAKAQECFRAGAQFHPPPIETVTVACGDEVYDAYFCHPVNPAERSTPVSR